MESCFSFSTIQDGQVGEIFCSTDSAAFTHLTEAGYNYWHAGLPAGQGNNLLAEAGEYDRLAALVPEADEVAPPVQEEEDEFAFTSRWDEFA